MQYTGRENDGTGLYYYRARYYSPELARFISEDPIGVAGGLNLFSYVDGDPIAGTDPFGLAVIGPDLPPGPNSIIYIPPGQTTPESCNNAFMGTRPVDPQSPQGQCASITNPERKCNCEYLEAQAECATLKSFALKIICGNNAIADERQCHSRWLLGK